jgi:hypothetical protein
MALEKTRDKSPLIDEEAQRRHSKRGGGEKLFGIERKFVGQLPEPAFLRKWYEEQLVWHHYRGYATEKARDKAIEAMRRKSQCGWRKYEYREKTLGERKEKVRN